MPAVSNVRERLAKARGIGKDKAKVSAAFKPGAPKKRRQKQKADDDDEVPEIQIEEIPSARRGPALFTADREIAMQTASLPALPKMRSEVTKFPVVQQDPENENHNHRDRKRKNRSGAGAPLPSTRTARYIAALAAEEGNSYSRYLYMEGHLAHMFAADVPALTQAEYDEVVSLMHKAHLDVMEDAIRASYAAKGLLIKHEGNKEYEDQKQRGEAQIEFMEMKQKQLVAAYDACWNTKHQGNHCTGTMVDHDTGLLLAMACITKDDMGDFTHPLVEHGFPHSSGRMDPRGLCICLELFEGKLGEFANELRGIDDTYRCVTDGDGKTPALVGEFKHLVHQLCYTHAKKNVGKNIYYKCSGKCSCAKVMTKAGKPHKTQRECTKISRAMQSGFEAHICHKFMESWRMKSVGVQKYTAVPDLPPAEFPPAQLKPTALVLHVEQAFEAATGGFKRSSPSVFRHRRCSFRRRRRIRDAFTPRLSTTTTQNPRPFSSSLS